MQTDINSAVIIVIIIVIIIAALITVVSYYPIFKGIRKAKTTPNDAILDNEDAILDARERLKQLDSTGREKANAALALVRLAYVPTHTITNTGMNYDDEYQVDHFRNSLTAETVIKAKCVGEKDHE
jgi:hypothetical protein